MVTVTSHTCVLRPTWTGTARPTTRSPSRALPRKLHLSSMVVKLSFASRSRNTPVPAAARVSARPTTAGANRKPVPAKSRRACLVRGESISGLHHIAAERGQP